MVVKVLFLFLHGWVKADLKRCLHNHNQNYCEQCYLAKLWCLRRILSLFSKMSVSILPSLFMIIKCIWNLKQLKFCLIGVRIPQRSALSSLPQVVECDTLSNCVQRLQTRFSMWAEHLPIQCRRMKNVLCAREGYRKHNKPKNSSSHTHFVHGLCPSPLLAVLIFDPFLIHLATKKNRYT